MSGSHNLSPHQPDPTPAQPAADPAGGPQPPARGPHEGQNYLDDSGLPQRLRDAALLVSRDGEVAGLHLAMLLMKAVTEIGRLRFELATLRQLTEHKAALERLGA